MAGKSDEVKEKKNGEQGKTRTVVLIRPVGSSTSARVTKCRSTRLAHGTHTRERGEGVGEMMLRTGPPPTSPKSPAMSVVVVVVRKMRLLGRVESDVCCMTAI